MRRVFIVFLFFTSHITLFTLLCNAQAGEWTWMKGYNYAYSTGVWGTQGISNPANVPPALYECFTWRDKDNNLWLFGGLLIGNLNSALWKYDITTNNWTWMKGPSAFNETGEYGTQGISSPNNYPGARSYGGFSWTDSTGNLWMYGGWGYGNGGFGLLSDLRKYDVATNEWTWMQGSSYVFQAANYGTFQVPSATSTPGGRSEDAVAWVDTANQFWLYGGQGFSGSYGDVWKYDPAINQWAWMNGPNTSNSGTHYGPKGDFGQQYIPGGRWIYSSWRDEAGNGWVYGGIDSAFNLKADLWMYDVTTNEWGWISGSQTPADTGGHGIACEASGNYFPSARMENRACWVDKCGNFWMFSGSSTGTTNDLWVYNKTNDEWSFIKGSFIANQYPAFGVQGISAATNEPGYRMGAVPWTDKSGNLWLFGGIIWFNGYMNDLWKFVPDPSCPVTASCYETQVQFNATDVMLCEKFCTDFTDQSVNNPTSWQWFFQGGSPASSILQNPTNICYSAPGTYDVTLITSNATGSDTLTLFNYIIVNPTPPTPTITQAGYTLTSSPASSYQWQFNLLDIPGATNQSCTILQTGYYTVVAGDSNGCKNSATVYVLISSVQDLNDAAVIFISPNPSNGNFTIEGLDGSASDKISVDVRDTLGQIIFSADKINLADPVKKEIDLCTDARFCVSTGIYFVVIYSEKFYDRENGIKCSQLCAYMGVSLL